MKLFDVNTEMCADQVGDPRDRDLFSSICYSYINLGEFTVSSQNVHDLNKSILLKQCHIIQNNCNLPFDFVFITSFVYVNTVMECIPGNTNLIYSLYTQTIRATYTLVHGGNIAES